MLPARPDLAWGLCRLWASCRIFGCKTQILQAKYQKYKTFINYVMHRKLLMFSNQKLSQMLKYWRGGLFSPTAEIWAAGWMTISVRNWQHWSLGQKIWFGQLSAISQLASWMRGKGGSEAYAPHGVTLPGSSGESRARGSVSSLWEGTKLNDGKNAWNSLNLSIFSGECERTLSKSIKLTSYTCLHDMFTLWLTQPTPDCSFLT